MRKGKFQLLIAFQNLYWSVFGRCAGHTVRRYVQQIDRLREGKGSCSEKKKRNRERRGLFRNIQGR